MTVTSQDISPFASLHEWLNRVKDGIQHAQDGVGKAWNQESHVPCSTPTTTPAGAVEKKAAPPSLSGSSAATSLVRLYLHINDIRRTMAASPQYDTLGTPPWPTMYMPPSKRQYTFDQHNPSMQKIALSISSHVLTESLITSKTAFLSLIAHAPFTYAEQWNRALSNWSHWKSMIQPDATIMTNTPHYTFHVRVIYPKAPNWNGSEKSSQTRCEKMRAYCRDTNHLLPMSHQRIGPITKLCESRYQEKTLECLLGRAIQSRYGWKCKLRKPDIQFLVTFQDDVMQIGITMYHASYSEYLAHLSHSGPHSILHTIQHIHDGPHATCELSPPPPIMSQYHIHANIHFLHDLTMRMLRTKSFLDTITERRTGSVLIDACSHGEFQIAHILIQLGCDIYAKDANGMNALVHAARHGENSVIAWLLDQKGFTWNMTLRSALLGALDGDHYSTISLLLTSVDSTSGILQRGCDLLTTFVPIIEHAIQQRCILGVMQILDYVEKKMQENWKNEKYESLLTSWFLASCATHDMILIQAFIMLYLRYHHARKQASEDVDQLSASMTLMHLTQKQVESTPIASATPVPISDMIFESTPFTIQLQQYITKLAKKPCSTTLSVEPRFGARYVNTMKRVLIKTIHQTQKYRHERYGGGVVPYIAYMSHDEINIIMSYCVGEMIEWKKKL